MVYVSGWCVYHLRSSVIPLSQCQSETPSHDTMDNETWWLCLQASGAYRGLFPKDMPYIISTNIKDEASYTTLYDMMKHSCAYSAGGNVAFLLPICTLITVSERGERSLFCVHCLHFFINVRQCVIFQWIRITNRMNVQLSYCGEGKKSHRPIKRQEVLKARLGVCICRFYLEVTNVWQMFLEYRRMVIEYCQLLIQYLRIILEYWSKFLEYYNVIWRFNRILRDV